MRFCLFFILAAKTVPKLQQLIRSLFAQRQAQKREERNLASLKARLDVSSKSFGTPRLISLKETVDTVILKMKGLSLMSIEFNKALLARIKVQRLNLSLRAATTKLGSLRKEFALITKGMFIAF